MLSKLAKLPGIARTAYNVVSFLLTIISAIMELVKLVEEEGPEDGGGKEKKSAVIKIIIAIYETLDSVVEVPVPKEKVVAFADKVIEAVVAFYNAINFFRRGTQTD